MSVTAYAQRKFDIESTEQEITLLEQAVIDGEYAERLESNADFQSLGRAYRKALEDRSFGASELKERLLSAPLPPEEAIRLREQVMLFERDRANTEDFLGFPARMKKQLRDLREDLDRRKEDLKKLKGEDYGG